MEEVDRVVGELMGEHAVPGVSLAIIDDFEVVHVRSYGEAEPGRPVTDGTLFQAASLSKPIAGLVVGAAAEEGMFDLDAQASSMLTSWSFRPDDPQGITLRMLFAHRAGVNVPGFPGYTLDEDLPELDRILLGVRDKNEPIGPVYEPGDYEYSGGGFLIGQLAIEDATGLMWEDIAENGVFDPLGLELSTYSLFTAEDRQLLAVGYRADGSEVAGGGWHQYPETAPASLWTTAEEYAAMVADVMRSYEHNAGVVLDQAMAQSLLDPDFAVGFGVSTEEEGIALGHAGANEGYRSQFMAIPALGQGVVVLTNSDSGLELTDEVIKVVAGQFGWAWTGWSTPLWAVVVGIVTLVIAAFYLRRLWRLAVSRDREAR